MGSTDPIYVGASAVAVQDALEKIPGIGVGGVQVSGNTTIVSSASGRTANYTDIYTILPSGAFASQATPGITVTSASLPAGFTAGVVRAAPPGLLTVNQANQLTTPGERDTFFKAILAGVNSYYNQFQQEVSVRSDPAPTANDYAFQWVLGDDPDPNSSDADAAFQSVALNGPNSLQRLAQSQLKDKTLNSLQKSFLLAQLLGHARTAPPPPGLDKQGVGYLNHLLQGDGDVPGDASLDQLAQYVSGVLAHEIGHGLGLPHSAVISSVQNGANEVQKITLVGGRPTDSFTLSYGGAFTVPLWLSARPPADQLAATAENVQSALAGLPGLGGSDLKVTGPFGGPFMIYFVDPSLPPAKTQHSRFALVNVPKIAVGGSVRGRVDIVTQGFASGDVVAGQAMVAGSLGSRDVMRDAGQYPGETFLPGISQALLRLSLGLNWTPTDGRQAVTTISQELKFGALSGKYHPEPPPGSTAAPGQEEDSFGADGPALAVLDSTGLLATDETTDFGTVTAGGPGGSTATQQFTLDNVGSVPATLNNVVVTGSSAFSVSPLPAGTILQPGDSLTVTVTFAPQGSGPFSGSLVIDSDTSNIPSTVDLTGTGQSSAGSISLAPWDNNVGGSQVGQPQAISSAENFAEPTVVNTGAAPLTITGIRVATGHGQGEYQVDPTVQFPVVVQPGTSFSFSFTFQPSAAGLRPGAFEILSDDAQTPVLRVPVVGTGVTANETANLANDYVAVENELDPSAPVLRQRTDSTGNWNFFLPPSTPFDVTVFDPTTGLVAHGGLVTSPSGVPTSFVTPEFGPSDFADTVGNGLPDDVKFAIGLDPNKVSTDGDGISDFDKLALGLDPLAGRPSVTGVVGALAVGGSAQDIKLVADPQNAGKLTAYVATTGPGAGLAIADVARFDHPVLLGQLALPGASQNVDVDAQRKVAAVASGQAGIQLVDISDPAKPRLLRTIPVNASQVALVDGIVYAGVGDPMPSLQAYDMATGDEIDSVPIAPTEFTALRTDGTMLYALESSTVLQVFDLSGPGITPRGSLNMPAATRLPPASYAGLFVADGVAWLAGALDQAAVDVSQPDNPHLLYDDRTRQGGGIALNGSGLGIIVGVGGLGTQTPNGLDVFQTKDPTVSGALVTRFLLPGVGQAVALSSGMAYVADGDAGVQIVNYLPFDTGSTPPSLDVQFQNRDITPTTPAFEVPEVSEVHVTVKATDDVQVRDVALLANGTVVQDQVTYPFNLSTILPSIAQAGNQVTLQVRATDTGGNSTLSPPIHVNLVAANPTVTAVYPADKSTQAPPLRRVTLFFSQPIDEATLTADNFQLSGPGGSVAPSALSVGANGISLTLVYPLLADGAYQLLVHAANVTNRVGLPLAPGDMVYTFQVATPPPPVVAPVLQAGRFSAAVAGPTSNQLRAVGDFNGDGIPDMAIPTGNGFGAAPLLVLLGQGDGSFKASTGVPAVRAGYVDAVVAGDFNNDGKLDLALATASQGVLVLLGNGDGTFQAPMNAVPDYPQLGVSGLAVGDFNGDGKSDLVAFGDPNTLGNDELTDGTTAVVLLGNGDGTFAYSPSPGRFFTYLPVTNVTAADVNGDGKADLIVTDKQNNNLYILKGNGDGSFPVSANGLPVTTTVPLPAGAKLDIVTDLNGDGIPDIAVTGNDQVSVLIGKGDGTFQPPVSYAAPGAYDITAADFSHDGRPDLVVSDLGTSPNPVEINFSGGALYVLHNLRNGTFAPPVTVTGVGSPFHLASGNFTAQGGPELLFTSIVQGVTALSPDGKGSFITAQRSTPLLGDPGDNRVQRPLDMVATADLNGDGNPDLIIPDRDGYIHVLLGNGAGGFAELPVIGAPQFGINNMLVADVNGDGKLDLVIHGFDIPFGLPYSMEVFFGNGDGTFQAPKPLTSVAGFIATGGGMALGDLNGDGKLDLVTAIGNGLEVYLGVGDGTFSEPSFLKFTSPGGYIQVSDLLNNGKMDIAALGPVLGPEPIGWQITVLMGEGDGTFSPKLLTYKVPAYAANLTVADVNGDGTPDLLFTVPHDQGDTAVIDPSSNNSIDVMLGNGDGTFQPPMSYGQFNGFASYIDITTADINRDGHPDILAATGNVTAGGAKEGPSLGLAVLLNKGDGTFGNPSFYDHAGTSAGGLAVADFNKDHLPDVVITNLNDNTFSLLLDGPPPGKAPQPQLAVTIGPNLRAPTLSLDEARTVLEAAIQLWAADGIGPAALARMRGVDLRVADLGGNALAQYDGRAIALDDNADGFGWFIDPTPLVNEEFRRDAVDSAFTALANGPAAGQMDLLTVLAHELGHVIGLEDDVPGSPGDLMTETLAAGVRCLPG